MRSTGHGHSTIRGGWAGTLIAAAAALALTAAGVVAGLETLSPWPGCAMVTAYRSVLADLPSVIREIFET